MSKSENKKDYIMNVTQGSNTPAWRFVNFHKKTNFLYLRYTYTYSWDNSLLLHLLLLLLLDLLLVIVMYILTAETTMAPPPPSPPPPPPCPCYVYKEEWPLLCQYGYSKFWDWESSSRINFFWTHIHNIIIFIFTFGHILNAVLCLKFYHFFPFLAIFWCSRSHLKQKF